MTDLRQAAEQALEALKGAREAVEHWASYAPEYSRTKYVLQDDLNAIEAQIDALKAALEEPQEPVGWFESPHGDFRANPLYKQEFPSSLLAWRIPLFIAPPQRPAEPQEPVAWISEVCCVGPEYGKRLYDALPIQSLQSGYYKHTPLYTAPPQRPTEPEERNFCPRCGKRTHTHDIHTCTPPHKEPR